MADLEAAINQTLGGARLELDGDTLTIMHAYGGSNAVGYLIKKAQTSLAVLDQELRGRVGARLNRKSVDRLDRERLRRSQHRARHS